MSSKKSHLHFIIVVIFAIFTAVTSVATAFLLGSLMDAAVTQDLSALIFTVALIIGIWPVDFIMNLIAVRFRISYVSEMLFLSKRQRMNFLFGRRLKTPIDDSNKDLSFFTADIDVLRNNYYTHKALAAARIARIVLSLGAMIWISPWLTLAILGAVLLFSFITAPFSKGMNKRTKAYSNETSKYVDVARDCIQGQRDIIAYDKQDVFLKRHEQANAVVEKARMKALFFEAIANLVGRYSNFALFFTTIGLGSYFVITGDIAMGALITVSNLMQNVGHPTMEFIEGLNGMRSAKGLLEKANEKNPQEPPKVPKATFEHNIEIKGLGLKYDEDTYVVKNLNLHFKKGGKYAIFAPSGYGKTSIARALALEFMAFDGSITIDGEDIRDVDTGDYNRILRYVRQDPYLFNDTALNNLTFLEERPEQTKLDRVLSITRASKFLSSEEDLTRPISNTSGLSGGEKQRIVLARALLHNPQILIMDEITSGIDLETSCKILSDLFTDKNLTCIVITHENDERFQCLFDEIVRLDKIA
ncbi:MAG: ABC transporter ATP-binding protein/permease [Defluviitaleaceae bacterium]|nr:ABC transporter ATP-binding protein/permease [Defluviitaleaceae bacterium]